MPAVKDIHWNRLTLSIPASWETIVKSPRHLIFEHELSPLLEIRWKKAGKKGKRASRRHTETIVKQFDHPPTPSGVQNCHPEISASLSKHFDITVLDMNPDGVPSLLLICRKCGTTILIGLHRKSFEWLGKNTAVLKSLHCRHGGEETEYWQIQDFFFSIPDGFELDSCSFQFGISNLLFKNKQADLRICRLAPASEHLNRSDFKALFAAFCSAPLESMQVVDVRTLRYHTSPAIIDQIWQRLRKQRPFRQASFSHFPDSDRILGYMIAAKHPPSADVEEQLENGYGIIQETAKETGTHP